MSMESDTYPPPATCPITVMYEDSYYVFRGETVTISFLDGLEDVGSIQSCVSVTQMPEENYQTNGETFLNRTLLKKDNCLYVDSDEDGVYWVFEYFKVFSG